MEIDQMAITAKDVAALRKQTGVGMADCKKALEEADGDVEQAKQILREKLKGKMDERTDRAAAEGRIAVAQNADNTELAIIELVSETDFAARNEQFGEAAMKIADLALAGPVGEVQVSDEMKSIVDELRITIKENISVRSGQKIAGDAVGSYVHHTGTIGAAVAAEGTIDQDTLTGICQHITAHVPTPLAVDEQGLPQDLKDKAMSEAKQEAIDSGKPEQIAEKIAAGKYQKWVAENTLLGQQYVKDMEGKSTVGDIVGKDAKITTFLRYLVGG
jgi:elongation factor Ts